MSVRAAVIGAGHFAYRVHIPVLAARNEVTLDSVCRRGRAELDLIAAEFGFAFATEDWRDVLERDIDIAVIATPHHLHFEQAMAFLEKGCHVLVEKPMCLDPSDAWTLARKSREAGREVIVSYGWHYKEGLSEVRGMIDRVGRIEHVVCHMASFTRNVFSGDGAVSAWTDVKIQPQAATWQTPDAGGGFAYGQLSHALGLLFWLSDLRIASVGAVTLNAANGVDLHDAAHVRFENGATGVLSGSCGVPPGHGFEVDIRIYGTDGSVLLDIGNERAVLKRPGGERDILEVPAGQWKYSCEGPANALVDLALGEGSNESDAGIGARAVEALHALTTSSRMDGAAMHINGAKR